MLGYTRRDSLAENRAIVNKQVCILKLIKKKKFHIYIRSAFTYFSVKGGGGGAENLVYGSLPSSFMAFLCVLQ